MEAKAKPTVDDLLAWAETRPPVVYCRLCGKPLTDPRSVEAGVGPICIDKAQSEGEEA